MIRDVQETSKAYGIQSSGQKRPFPAKSDDGKASDSIFKRLDKPISYRAGGRASVLKNSYRNTEIKKPDAYRRSVWDNQSNSNFRPSKFQKKENIRCPQPVAEGSKSQFKSWRKTPLFCYKLKQISNDSFIL